MRLWLLSALLVTAPGLVIVSERLDHALGSLLATKDASGTWVALATLDLVVWWVFAVVAIVVVFALAWIGIQSTFRERDWRAPTGWVLAGVWAAWTVTGAVSVSVGGLPEWVRQIQEFGRFAIAGLAVAMLVAIGDARGVSPRATWKSATLVRVHLLVLGLLFGLIYLLPMTAGQAADVFRTWSDTNGQQAAFGLAAALVLGEMIRESGLRILKAENRGFTVRAALEVRQADPATGKAATAPEPTPEEFDPEGLRAFRMLAAIPTAILFVGAVSSAADSVLLDTQLDWPVLKTCIAALVCGLFLIVLMRTVVEPAKPVDLQKAPRGVPPIQATAVLWIVGLAAAILIAFEPWLAYLLAVALLLFVEWQRSSGNVDTPIKWALPLNGARALALGVALSVLWDPIDVSRGIGVAGVALLACAGMLGILHFFVRRAGQRHLPIFHIRIPVVTVLSAVVFVAVWQSPATFHQARVIAADSEAHGTITIAIQDWLDRELEAAKAGNQNRDPEFLPVLLVGASGGGSKAAYWTDLVLDCAVGGQPLPSHVSEKSECGSDSSAGRRARGVFLTSSVSGGSVGVAHYVQHLASVQSGESWVDDSSGQDLLSPTIAWGFFHDFPLLLASWLTPDLVLSPPNPGDCKGTHWECRYNLDRAAIQENAIAGRVWESTPNEDETLTGLWESSIAPDATTPNPATVFNSALSGSRGRVLVSPFDLAPKSIIDERCLPVALNPSEVVTDAVDAQDMLAEYERTRFDFDVTTAALLSGRFPIVDPPARIGTASTVEPKPDDDAPCLSKAATRLPAVFVRDGGYVENSGLLTIVQLLPAIQRGIDDWQTAYVKAHPGVEKAPDVVVWTVSVDDDPIDLANPVKAKAERPAPSSIAKRAGPDNTLTALAREALLLRTAPVACYLRISPDPRIGAHAATGWALSKTTRLHDLVASVGPKSQNVHAIEALHAFLAGESRNCAKVGPAGSGPAQPAAP